MARSYTKKITVRQCGYTTGDCEEIAVSAGQETPILRVYGKITERTTANGEYGQYSVFSGEIEAVNLNTRQVYRSRKLIVPEPAQSLIDSLTTNMDEGVSVQFAIDITVNLNSSNKPGTKFFFGVKSLIENKQEDELTKIASQLGDLPAIEAPKSKKK